MAGDGNGNSTSPSVVGVVMGTLRSRVKMADGAVGHLRAHQILYGERRPPRSSVPTTDSLTSPKLTENELGLKRTITWGTYRTHAGTSSGDDCRRETTSG